MSFPEYTSDESHGTVRLITRRVYTEDDEFVPMSSYKQQRRGTSTASPATNPPYPIVWVQRYEPMRRHRQKAKIKRTVESFLTGAEVLHGDGINDDTAVLQSCLNRAKALANANTFDADVVVSLTRTYLCNGQITINAVYGTGVSSANRPLDPQGADPDESYYLEITGPGGIMRTPMPNGLVAKPYLGSDRFFPQLALRDVKRLRLTSFKIAGWRRQTQSGGLDGSDYEGQAGVWEGNNPGSSPIGEDIEFRNLTIEHVMGDAVTSFANGSRIYNCRFVNLGRLVASNWATDVDFYGNYCERNSASIFDIETIGSTQMTNQVFRYNEFWNCHGILLHVPSWDSARRYCTATNGSNVLTASGNQGVTRFDVRDLNREVRNGLTGVDDPIGDGMQPDTVITAFTDTTATLSKPASGVTVATGFRRIYSYIGSRIDGIQFIGNVRHCSNSHTSPGGCTFQAAGGVRVDGSKTVEDFVWEDNIWDRPASGGAFWDLAKCDRATIRNNRGPWRSIYSGAQVVKMSQVTHFVPFVGTSEYTSTEVRAENPHVFQSPV
jgi:hypothetical protein